MPTHPIRRRASRRPEPLRPLHHAGNAHPKQCRRRTARPAKRNRADDSFPKITRIGSRHRCWPPTPASILNQKSLSEGIPFCDSEPTNPALDREIRFESVSFAYAGAPSPSLDQISFTIPAGSVTALVGMSGAGKTTIVNLLLRLYRQDSGSILVDGVRLDELNRESWLSRLTAAGQDVELIEGTVQDNLRVARPLADLSAMRAAAETAGILDTIEHLPQGFDSWIGQQGLKLSGGQRQRLGLARALLRDPDILILDEATNALNSGLEHKILRAIRQKLAGRTLLIITHRLETAMSADNVICIGAGRALESGSPAELQSRSVSAFQTLLGDVSEKREAIVSRG